MPFAETEGRRLYWKLEGEGDRPPLLLLNSIGTDMGLWDPVIPYLLRHFQLLRMDTRGHGASDAGEGDYSLSGLASDAIAVMDAAAVDVVFVAGVSLGGMVAMELALRAPARVSALALICTSATMDQTVWADRVKKVRSGGTGAIADLAMSRFLSADFARSHAPVAQSVRRGLLEMDDEGYAGAGAAIRDMDLIDRISGIAARTMVIAGASDVSTPFEGNADRIVKAIPDAELVMLDCAHLAPLEAPGSLAAALIRFLSAEEGLRESEDALFESGLRNRRRVLGDAWVDHSLTNRTPFNAEFQAMITRIAWHEVWGRPGLDEKTRRLLVIAMTATLGRWEEFRLHVKAGLERGGFSRDELKEVLMQLAIYAGVPAANSAFTEAAEVIEVLAGASD
jgi:3-oxoadipate enol-lactonase/4-carboxymuconolactone decarboxylase